MTAPAQLYRHDVAAPDGKPVGIFYRENQRRPRPETDGEFCLRPDETGAGFKPVEALVTVDGKPDGAPSEEVRVCREEAQTAQTGHIFATGRIKPSPKDAAASELPMPGGRARPLPLDKPYATQHADESVSCDSKLALESAPDCGCGVGLERWLPGDRNDQTAAAFYYPNHTPIGPDEPLDDTRQQAQHWGSVTSRREPPESTYRRSRHGTESAARSANG